MDFQEIQELIFNGHNCKYSANLQLIYGLNDKDRFEKIILNIKGKEKFYIKTYFYHCNLYQKYQMNGIKDIDAIIKNMTSDKLSNLELFKKRFEINNDANYWKTFLKGVYENSVFHINSFMNLEFHKICYYHLYQCGGNCICGYPITNIHHIASFNNYLNNGVVILRVGSCCIKRFLGSNTKTCIKCLVDCKENYKNVDKVGRLFMCKKCYDISDKCKLCNKITKYDHNIIDCKNKYNTQLRSNSKKEKVCTYGDCNNFCKKYDFCKDHIPLSECKHCNVMYKPESSESEFINNCNDCFKCFNCNIFKKENNKKSFDVYCTQCNVEYDKKQIEKERLQKILDIEYEKQQIEKARLQKIKDDYDEEHKIYNCKICNIIIDKNQSKYGNKCYNCNNNKGQTIEKSNTCRQCGKFISDHQTKFGNKCYDCNNMKK